LCRTVELTTLLVRHSRRGSQTTGGERADQTDQATRSSGATWQHKTTIQGSVRGEPVSNNSALKEPCGDWMTKLTTMGEIL